MFYPYCNIDRRTVVIDVIIIIIIIIINITVILDEKGEKCILRVHSTVVNKKQLPPVGVTVHKARECIFYAEYTVSEKLRAASFFT